MVQFDTLEAVNIEFQITALTLKDTLGTNVSPTIKIIVNTEDVYIPDIIVGSLTSPVDMAAANSPGIYEFDDPFSTSDPANYLIQNHALILVTPSDEVLTLVKDASTGRFSVTIDLTSTRTVTFSVYAEIYDFPDKKGQLPV